MKITKLFMDTVVEIQVHSYASLEEPDNRINRAFEAFRHVEDACSRFQADSEVMRVCQQINTHVPVSPFLYEPLRFALEMAKWTGGVFDPTVGKTMEERGFNRHYLTRKTIQSEGVKGVSYRDIVLDEKNHTVFLHKPLVIDLGAVAKGFAIDLAAHELNSLEGFMINAGGDLYLGGLNEQRKPWRIGIQHPIERDTFIDTVDLSNQAICTSGNYERRGHILSPQTGNTPENFASCSVIAPYAMMADALATTAFLIEPENAESMMREAQVQAVFITPDLRIQRVGVK